MGGHKGVCMYTSACMCLCKEYILTGREFTEVSFLKISLFLMCAIFSHLEASLWFYQTI